MAHEMKELTEIGFSALEANVYVTLLQCSPATGYTLARQLHKPVSNTYKVLDCLCKKGCVVVDDASRPRRYSALPLSEYFDRLEQELKKKRENVEARLKSLTGPASYSGIYRLDSLDQVYDRAARLIGRARLSILVDAFPVQVERMRKPLEKAVRRHVRVVLKAYSHVTLPGVDLVCSDLGPEIPSWPGELLFVVADGDEYMLAFVNDASGTVHEAVWSQNLYLAIIAYNSLLAELLLTRLLGVIESDPGHSALKRVMAAYHPLHTHRTPAFKKFVRQFDSRGV